jgi:hypothetical protein
MEYRTGTVGRIIAVRFDHGEDFLAGLREIVLKEHIASGWFQIIGALDRADVVTGPKEPVVPPDPIWRQVAAARYIWIMASQKSICTPRWAIPAKPSLPASAATAGCI